jgi:hypothetical protein
MVALVVIMLSSSTVDAPIGVEADGSQCSHDLPWSGQ